MNKICHILLIIVTCLLINQTLTGQNKVHIDSLQKSLESTLLDTNRVNILIQLNIAFCSINSNELKYAEEALGLSKKLDFKNGIVKSYNRLGFYQLQTNGDYDQAEKYYDSALVICKKIQNPALLADTYITLAELYASNQSYFQKALEYYNNAIQLFEKTRNKIRIAEIYNRISGLYSSIGDKDNALSSQQQSLVIMKALNNQLEIALAYTFLSKIHADFEDQNQQLECLKNAEAIFKSFKPANKELQSYQEYYNQFLNAYADYYGVMDQSNKAIEYYELALNFALSKRKSETTDYLNNSNIAEAYFNIGNIHFSQKEIEEAEKYYNKGREILEKIQDYYSLGHKLQQIARNYRKFGNLGTALQYYQEEIKIWEKISCDFRLANTYYLIGWVYESLGDYQKVLDNCKLGQDIAQKINSVGLLVLLNLNIAKADYYLGKYDEAYNSAQKSLKLNERFKDTLSIIVNKYILGLVYEKRQEFNKAISLHNQTIQLKEIYSFGISTQYGNIPSESALARIYLTQKNYSLAMQYAMKSLEMAKAEKIREVIRDDCFTLSEIYEKKGDTKKALEYYKLHVAAKDEILNDDIKKKVQQEEIKNITERKESEIKMLNQEKQLQDTELKRQTFVSYTFIIGFIITLCFVFVFLWLYREKQKANKILAEQKEAILAMNEELQQLNEEILAQRDSLEEMNLTLHGKNEQIEEQMQIVLNQKKEITDSIHYAKRIQDAILPSESLLTAADLEHFVLFKPRDIVSGDFYWINSTEDYIVFAAVDCTGHGVPGAFMSMLGVAFLNEAVRNNENVQANLILNELRARVKSSLRQTGKEQEQKDGMDMALCVIDKQKSKLQFAGANNPLYLIRNNELIEFKADRMPIGIYIKEKDSFTNHEVEIQKGDSFYVFSDGFEDQFGGPTGKKFLTKNFKNLLVQLQSNTMEEQKEILRKSIIDWMGEHHEQIDDILVIGVKV